MKFKRGDRVSRKPGPRTGGATGTVIEYEHGWNRPVLTVKLDPEWAQKLRQRDWAFYEDTVELIVPAFEPPSPDTYEVD